MLLREETLGVLIPHEVIHNRTNRDRDEFCEGIKRVLKESDWEREGFLGEVTFLRDTEPENNPAKWGAVRLPLGLTESKRKLLEEERGLSMSKQEKEGAEGKAAGAGGRCWSESRVFEVDLWYRDWCCQVKAATGDGCRGGGTNY